MKKTMILLSLSVLFISCSTPKSDLDDILTLLKGNYKGYSNLKTEKFIGVQHSQPEGEIIWDGENLEKVENYYKPRTEGPYGVVVGWDGPFSNSERGVLKSCYVEWDDDLGHLVLIGSWESPSGSTCTYNFRPIFEGEDAGKIYSTMFTENWSVKGYKEIDKSSFKELVELFKKYYKETNDNKEPWKSTKFLSLDSVAVKDSLDKVSNSVENIKVAYDGFYYWTGRFINQYGFRDYEYIKFYKDQKMIFTHSFDPPERQNFFNRYQKDIEIIPYNISKDTVYFQYNTIENYDSTTHICQVQISKNLDTLCMKEEVKERNSGNHIRWNTNIIYVFHPASRIKNYYK